MLEHRACEFRPDFVFLFVHSDSRAHPLTKLVSLLMAGQPLPYEFLEETVRAAELLARLTREARR